MRDTKERAPLYGTRAEQGRLRYVIDPRDWKPMKIGETELQGFSWIPVAKDEGGAWESYWMKMSPGARSPHHVHHTTELLYIADGVFSDADGADYFPGDVVWYRAGSRHMSFSTHGCMVFVVARTGSSVDE